VSIVTAAAAAPAQPGEWIADPAASTVSFTVRNFGLRFVIGQVPLVSVGVTVGPGGQPVSVRAETVTAPSGLTSVALT
jgi:polyisoprenoid-binding protein YceI